VLQLQFANGPAFRLKQRMPAIKWLLNGPAKDLGQTNQLRQEGNSLAMKIGNTISGKLYKMAARRSQ